MRLVALLLLQAHGDSARLESVYFWAAVLLALTPVLVFGGIGTLVVRKIWREREAARGPGAGSGPSEVEFPDPTKGVGYIREWLERESTPTEKDS